MDTAYVRELPIPKTAENKVQYLHFRYRTKFLVIFGKAAFAPQKVVEIAGKITFRAPGSNYKIRGPGYNSTDFGVKFHPRQSHLFSAIYRGLQPHL